MLGGIFDACDGELVSDVAGDADHEEVSEALVEEKFRAEPGVGAGENDGVGDLSLCDFESLIDVLVGVCFESLAESGVTFDNTAECVFGVWVEPGDGFSVGLNGGFGLGFFAGEGDGECDSN